MSKFLLVGVTLALLGGAFTLGSAAAQEEQSTLSPLNDSGVSGTVSLTPQGQQTVVDVTLEGAPADSVHPGHIHTGADCSDYAGIEVNLTDISVGADGMGSASTTVDMPILDIEDGNHVVIFHAGPTLEDDPTPIACAELPVSMAQPSAGEAPAVSPPAAGSGGFLDDESGGLPVLPFVLLGIGVAAVAAGAFGLRLSRSRR